MPVRPILLVEDCDDDALIFKRVLKRVKLESPVQCVCSVDDAICYLEGQGEFADRNRFPFPSIIFIDLKLPNRDGFELVEWIKKRPDMRNLFLVVLSGEGRTLDIAKAYNLGANSFLTKPIRPEDFENLLKGHAISGMADPGVSQP